MKACFNRSKVGAILLS